MTKFHRNDSNTTQIRCEILPGGKVITFGIAGTDLSTMQFDTKINFDKESDAVLEKYSDSKDNMTFEYVPNVGFDEVDAKTRSWFK